MPNCILYRPRLLNEKTYFINMKLHIVQGYEVTGKCEPILLVCREKKFIKLKLSATTILSSILNNNLFECKKYFLNESQVVTTRRRSNKMEINDKSQIVAIQFDNLEVESLKNYLEICLFLFHKMAISQTFICDLKNKFVNMWQSAKYNKITPLEFSSIFPSAYYQQHILDSDIYLLILNLNLLANELLQ